MEQDMNAFSNPSLVTNSGSLNKEDMKTLVETTTSINSKLDRLESTSKEINDKFDKIINLIKNRVEEKNEEPIVQTQEAITQINPTEEAVSIQEPELISVDVPIVNEMPVVETPTVQPVDNFKSIESLLNNTAVAPVETPVVNEVPTAMPEPVVNEPIVQPTVAPAETPVVNEAPTVMPEPVVNEPVVQPTVAPVETPVVNEVPTVMPEPVVNEPVVQPTVAPIETPVVEDNADNIIILKDYPEQANGEGKQRIANLTENQFNNIIAFESKKKVQTLSPSPSNVVPTLANAA